MRALLLLCLVAWSAAADEIAPAELAEQFLDAHREGGKARQAMLAARPARDVSYTLAVYWLIGHGHPEVAKALVAQRHGPERAGLQRLYKTITAGLLPTRAQLTALDTAEALAAARRPGVLKTLAGAGEPVEGTVLGADILWLRARIAAVRGERADATRLAGQAADFARAIGWLQRVQQAEALRLKVAGNTPDALKAADGLANAVGPRGLDDPLELIKALAHRGRLRLRYGEKKEGRADLAEAARLAGRKKKPLWEAEALAQLALFWHRSERSARRALDYYERATALLETKSSARPRYRDLLFNSAVALTELARYDDAVARLDQLLADADIEGDLRRRSLSQRAYVLRRQGRLELAAEAYRVALADTKAPRERRALLVQVGELDFLRGDLRRAEVCFGAVLEEAPDHVDALVGRGSVRVARGRLAGARADFDAASKAAVNTLARARVMMKRALAESRAGRVGLARRAAGDALKAFIEAALKPDAAQRDYGSTAVAYTLLGELILRDQELEKAEEIIAKGAVFFHRLNDPAHSVPAYARWMLTLLQLGRLDDALERGLVMRADAQGSGSDLLVAISRTAEAIAEMRAGRNARADELLVEAAALARKAGNAEREATAHLHRAFSDPERAVEHAKKAIDLMAAQRLEGARERTSLPGEHPAYAPSIAAAASAKAGDAADTLLFVERARAQRLLVALGGRATLLDRTQPAKLYQAYVDARSALLAARASGERGRIVGAEKAFDTMAARLRERSQAAQIAFAATPDLASVQRALQDHEALLLMLDDPYARVLVALTKSGAVAKAYEADAPLAGLDELLKGKKRLIVAPDGRITIGGVPFEGRTAAECFEIRYVASAASLLRLRSGRSSGDGIGRVGAGPPDLAEPQPGKRLRLLHAGTPVTVRMSHSRVYVDKAPDADTVVLAGAKLVGGTLPGIDGLAATSEALFLGGVRQVVVPLKPVEPEFWVLIYGLIVDRGLPPAVAIVEARRQWKGAQPEFVVWGVP
ncbi:MAG: hypothetical protein ACYTGN_00780 [Planctomycetota bacterium]|jgi:hypothetical protein